MPSDDEAERMVLEGIVTTLNVDGSVNISPMGPVVDRLISRIQLRPFHTSTTYANLKRTSTGVFHVTDDVELMARCAVGQPDPMPEIVKLAEVEGWRLENACRWYALRAQRVEDEAPRAKIECQIVASGQIRDFFGFNRAKHAVVEAAILVTRIGLLPLEQIQKQFQQFETLIDKTAGDQERRAFEFLKSKLRDALNADQS